MAMDERQERKARRILEKVSPEEFAILNHRYTQNQTRKDILRNTVGACYPSKQRIVKYRKGAEKSKNSDDRIPTNYFPIAYVYNKILSRSSVIDFMAKPSSEAGVELATEMAQDIYEADFSRGKGLLGQIESILEKGHWKSHMGNNQRSSVAYALALKYQNKLFIYWSGKEVSVHAFNERGKEGVAHLTRDENQDILKALGETESLDMKKIERPFGLQPGYAYLITTNSLGVSLTTNELIDLREHNSSDLEFFEGLESVIRSGYRLGRGTKKRLGVLDPREKFSRGMLREISSTQAWDDENKKNQRYKRTYVSQLPKKEDYRENTSPPKEELGIDFTDLLEKEVGHLRPGDPKAPDGRRKQKDEGADSHENTFGLVRAAKPTHTQGPPSDELSEALDTIIEENRKDGFETLHLNGTNGKAH